MGFPLTRDASAVPETSYNGAAAQTAVLLCGRRANFYGGQMENNHTADVFIQFYNAAAVADVTVGTDIVFTLRLPASGGLIWDHTKPWHHFTKGIVYAVCSTRTGSSAPGAAASVKLYFSGS